MKNTFLYICLVLAALAFSVTGGMELAAGIAPGGGEQCSVVLGEGQGMPADGLQQGNEFFLGARQLRVNAPEQTHVTVRTLSQDGRSADRLSIYLSSRYHDPEGGSQYPALPDSDAQWFIFVRHIII